MNRFIDSQNFDEFIPLAGDMSPRKYFRCVKDGQSSIMMVYPGDMSGAREELEEFIRIGKWLNAVGAKAPRLLDADTDLLCARFEDLGTMTFRNALNEDRQSQSKLYTLACDVLKHLKEQKCLEDLPCYRDSAIHYKRRQIVEYYLPLVTGRPCSESQMQGYLNAWDEIEEKLDPCPQGFLHMDYHLDNLMWLPEEEGIKRCGLIDYQDAVKGPLPYDLVNLLEDARVNVPADLQTALIDRYCEGMDGPEKTLFLKWYRILGTQFHCRVLGLFIMQAVENNRDDYLPHLPRLQSYIAAALENPLLAPLRNWFEQQGVDFTPLKDLNGDVVRERYKNIVIPDTVEGSLS